MSAEITPAEGGTLVTVVTAFVTTLIGALRLQSQIARLRGRIADLEGKVERSGSDANAIEERLGAMVADAVQKAVRDQPPATRQSTGAFSSTEALDRMVAERVREHVAQADAAQNAKIEGVTERLRDIRGLVETVAKAVLEGSRK